MSNIDNLSPSLLKLTEYEAEAWSKSFNFTDGHARFLFDERINFQDVLNKIVISRKSQYEIEQDFHHSFFALGYQPGSKLSNTLFLSSASLSIEIIANHLRICKNHVCLIEPTFDNIADILKRHSVPLYPLSEQSIGENGLLESLEALDRRVDTLFFVIPNNPTGFYLEESNFQSLVDFCLERKIKLILDFSFRFFSKKLTTFDQYKILYESQIQFLAFEDTGKCWPTHELKVSALLCSDDLLPEIKNIYSDLFICASPLILALLSEYIQFSVVNGFENTVGFIADTNRSVFRQLTKKLPIHIETKGDMPVEWIKLLDGNTAVQLETYCRNKKVYILPGNAFFWNSKSLNSVYFRVALMRDPIIFKQGIESFVDSFFKT